MQRSNFTTRLGRVVALLRTRWVIGFASLIAVLFAAVGVGSVDIELSDNLCMPLDGSRPDPGSPAADFCAGKTWLGRTWEDLILLPIPMVLIGGLIATIRARWSWLVVSAVAAGVLLAVLDGAPGERTRPTTIPELQRPTAPP